MLNGMGPADVSARSWIALAVRSLVATAAHKFGLAVNFPTGPPAVGVFSSEVKKKCKAVSVTGWGCRGSHIFYTIGSQMAVRSAVRSCRALPPGIFLVFISVRGWIIPSATVRLERLDQLEKKIQWPNRDSNTTYSDVFLLFSILSLFLFHLWEPPTWATIDRCPLLCNGLLQYCCVVTYCWLPFFLFWSHFLFASCSNTLSK
jgi:hypothetical protein